MDLVPQLGLTTAYVDNPFFDPLDPATALVLELPTTRGHNAQFDLDGGVRARWSIDAVDRAEASLFGRYSRWAGTAETSGWNVGLRLGWHHLLGPDLDLRGELLGAASSIALFPDDDLVWGEARFGVQWTLDRDGRHRVNARIGYGHRAAPDRLVDAQTGATGQRDHLVRSRVALRSRLGAVRAEPSYAMDLVRPAVGGLEYDTHAVALSLGRPLGGLYADIDLAGWLRRFTEGARDDLGLAAGARIAAQPWRGIEVAGRYRYLRSTSDSPLGDYAQHFAGLEFTAWYAPVQTPAGVSGAPAAPVRTANGWQFRLRAPSARTVALVGDFNDWSTAAHPLQGPDADGWWQVTVPLAAGRYTYMFVLDGERFVRPVDAPGYADDGFGGEVGVIYILPSDERRASR